VVLKADLIEIVSGRAEAGLFRLTLIADDLRKGPIDDFRRGQIH